MSESKVLTETGETIEVLHVDDASDFTELTATFLERVDGQFTVETATTVDSGLERIDTRPPDCIVSDYNMPGTNGIEFLQAVRERCPDLPFILFTGKGSEAVASDAISAGVTDYLQKGSGTERYELLANRIRNAVEARREAERADRQEQLMRLTEFAGDTGGFELDRESGTILLTAGARRIIGHPDQAEIPLEEAIALFHPEDREDIQQTLSRAFETGEELHGAWRLQPEAGDERLIDMTITPVVEDGEVTKLRGAGHDITERKERQQELRRSERRLNALLEHSTDRINVTDAEGRYTFVSPSVESLFGHDPADLIGESAFEYIHPDDRAETRATFEQILSDPDGIYSVEYRYRDDDGSWRWVESRGTNRLDDPAIEGIVINSREITDRKQREQELARNRDLMANMEQLADAGAWEYDSETEQLTITDGTRRLYGLDPDADLTLEAALDAVHPDDRDRLADRLNTCLETGKPYEIDVRFTTADGTQRWLTAHGERVSKGDAGSVVRGYIRDITQQQAYERDLKRYRTVFNELPDPVVVYDEEGHYDLVNDAAAEIRDTPREELIGTKSPYLEQIQEENPAEYDAFLDGSRDTLRVELTDEFAGRGKRTLQCDLCRVKAETGFAGTVIVTRDVTERKEHRTELEQMETITEALTDAVYVLDEEGRFTYVSDEFVELVGYDRDTILGSTPSLVKDEDAVERAENQLGRLLSNDGPETVTFEVTLQPRDGDPIICEDHMGVLPYEGGQFDGSVGTLRDITDDTEPGRNARCRSRPDDIC